MFVFFFSPKMLLHAKTYVHVAKTYIHVYIHYANIGRVE